MSMLLEPCAAIPEQVTGEDALLERRLAPERMAGLPTPPAGLSRQAGQEAGAG